MNQEQKQQLIAKAKDYITEKGLSNNEVARQTKINPSYLSNMLNNRFTYAVDGKEGQIADRWFQQLAEFIGIEKQYWNTVQTRQLIEGLSKLQECKDAGKTGLIIGATGVGKTDFINLFCNKNPQHTFRITVSSLYKLVDIVNELCEKLGVETSPVTGARIQAYSLKVRVEKIIDKLKEVKRSGSAPIIIFDEGENLEISVLKMLKALYDGLKDHCSIVIIGTDQLMNKLLNLKKRNRDAIPQLYRRFKAGLKHISPINKHEEFPKFFEKMNVTDKGLCQLLTEVSDNYGELHDYLEPLLREADIKGKPLNEAFFRTYYNMPNKKTA